LVVLLTLVGGVIGTTFGLVRAEQARRAEADRAEGERLARQEAQAVLDFVEQKVLAAARPEGQEGGLGHDVKLRRAIEAALPFVDQSFKGQPLIEARLRQTLGISFLNLGEPEKAAEQFEKARAIRTKVLGSGHPDTLKSKHGLANSYDDLGRQAEGLKLREETLALRKVKLGPNHPDTLASMHNLAISYSDLGRHAEALKLLEETLALEKAKLGANHPSTFRSIINLANSYRQFGRNADAVKLLEETLPVMKAQLPNHPVTFSCMTGLAFSYDALGRHADARKLHAEALAQRMAKLGPDHFNTLESMNSLIGSYENDGLHADALRVINDAIRQHPDSANFYDIRGNRHCHLGDFRKAMADFDKALELDPSQPLVWYKVAALYLHCGDVDRYRNACRELLDLGDKHAAYRTEYAEQTAKTCALAPGAVADFSRVEWLAQRSVTGTEEHQFRRWFILAKGLTDYRGAHYAAAIEWLERFAPKDDGAHSDGTAFAALAMAHYRLGHADQGRASLNSARHIIAKKPPDWKRGTNWMDWLHCETLSREAEELIGPASPPEPPERGAIEHKH
jgi:tetratricopeptide (TPR) repeat protein